MIEVNKIFNWFYDLVNTKEFSIIKEGENLKEKIFISKDISGLSFVVGRRLNKEKFIIEDEFFKIKINHFITKVNYKQLGTRICNAYNFQSFNFDENRECFQSYYSNIENDFFLMDFFKDYKNPLLITVGDFNFSISTSKINSNIKDVFLCVDCNEQISHKLFKHYINNITVSIGFFTGKFYKSEEFYLQSSNVDFNGSVEFLYKSSNQKMLFFPKPFSNSPEEFSWKMDGDVNDGLFKKWESHIDKEKLVNFIKLLIEKPIFYFSVKMLFNFYNYPAITRIPILFVILETICEEINKNSTQEKIEKQHLKSIGLHTLENCKEEISINDYDILKDVINNVDSSLAYNSVNFERAFKVFLINLNNEEVKVLKNRNHFFHGRIIPESEKINLEEDFYSIENSYSNNSFRLYILISKLMLKQIGFSGFIINHTKLFEEEQDSVKESYFIKI